jgi:hypothetical protein
MVQLGSSGDVHVSAKAEPARNPIATKSAKNTDILIRSAARQFCQSSA